MGSNLQVAIPGHMSTAVNNEEDGSSDEEEGEEMEVLDPNHVRWLAVCFLLGNFPVVM